MEQTVCFTRRVLPTEEGGYFRLPFEVPAGVCRMDVEYHYPRHETRDGQTREINIIDLALESAADGYLGASGSDRNHIWVQEAGSAKGYASVEPKPGLWHVVMGAYKVQPDGVEVEYTIRLTMKERRLYKGDTHMHTTGSDGALTCAQLADVARQTGLDFMIVTDHNNYVQNAELPALEGVTAIPGMEWTHYKGHSGFWGTARPVQNPFGVNSHEEMRAKLAEAKAGGAVVVLNHPLCPNCGWKWGLDDIDFDLLEIWNGGIPLSVLPQSVDWWHKLLCLGKRLRITGGSDFHSYEAYRSVGLPTVGVYADSNSAADLLAAMKQGNSFVVYGAHGPTVYAEAAGRILGECAPAGSPVDCRFERLAAGDEVHIITDTSRRVEPCSSNGAMLALREAPGPARFIRFEVHRPSISGALGQLPCLVSNPIFFE